MNHISKFLCLCAGADVKLISKYPSEVSRYSSIGATIVFTGFFAALSGGYALYKIFNDLVIAIILGLIWGFMIFNLDRYIVMSIKKKDRIWNELLTALPRIILAIIISIVVAKPLEVRIFADRIAREIGDKEIAQMKIDRNQSNEIYQISKVKNAVEEITTEILSTEGKKNQDSE